MPKNKPKRRRGLAVGQRDPEALLAASAQARAAGALKEAAQLARRALAARPKDARLHNSLGITLAAAGDVDAAVASFGKALQLDPGMLQARYNLALTLEQAGRLEAALDAYRHAHEAAPTAAEPAYNFGGLLMRVGQAEEAIGPLVRCVAARPDFAEAWGNLGSAQRLAGRAAEAVTSFEQALSLDAELVTAWSNLGLLRKAAGDEAGALAAFDEVLRRHPDHATAGHMRAALTGQTPARGDRAYVAALFDDYASRFDESLMGELACRIPDDLDRLIGPGRCGCVLDLGCGTGLMGERLRARSTHLVGVDLSAEMVRRARARGIYDALEVQAIEEFLAEGEERFELMVAADVLVYCGELTPLFAAVAARLEVGGRFAFSTELAEGAEPFRLRATGRYAHRPEHVAEAAAGAGLRIEERRDADLRLHAGQPLAGQLHLARRQGV